MYKSIVVSCDTYYYQLANDMGIDAIAALHGQFGFGSAHRHRHRTAKPTGVLPSQEWKQAALQQPEQQKWYAGETICIGIGQGYNAYTPLQLAARDGHARQRRRDVPAAPRDSRRRPAHRRAQRYVEPRARAQARAQAASTSSS